MCSDVLGRAFRKRLEAVKRATTNVAAVYAKDLLPLRIDLAPLAEQIRIAKELDRRMSIVEEIQSELGAGLARASRLRQAILKQAFEGRLVRQDTSDEPASILLERIRAKNSPAYSAPAQGPRRSQRKSLCMKETANV